MILAFNKEKLAFNKEKLAFNKEKLAFRSKKIIFFNDLQVPKILKTFKSLKNKQKENKILIILLWINLRIISLLSNPMNSATHYLHKS